MIATVLCELVKSKKYSGITVLHATHACDQFCGSLTFWYGSRSFFASILLKVHLHHSSKIKKVIKKSQTVEIKVFLTIFCMMMEGSGCGKFKKTFVSGSRTLLVTNMYRSIYQSFSLQVCQCCRWSISTTHIWRVFRMWYFLIRISVSVSQSIDTTLDPTYSLEQKDKLSQKLRTMTNTKFWYLYEYV